MAGSIPWEELAPIRGRRLTVLDPMMGSGTTLAIARSLGHQAIGLDSDPLAVLISRVWTADLNPKTVRKAAIKVLQEARAILSQMKARDAYPGSASEETKKFIRYWFDLANRRQLAALTQAIRMHSSAAIQDALWCAFSRLIIAKKAGVSLAMDVSHSRPHKVLDKSDIRPFDHFEKAVEKVVKALPDGNQQIGPPAKIRRSDARRMPIDDASVDLIITSPPYLNAIDYLRGHKLSLVWMGYQIEDIRELRSLSIGTEKSSTGNLQDDVASYAMRKMGNCEVLPMRERKQLAKYLHDMDKVFSEMHRVLKPGGRIILVVGDSTRRGIFLKNSAALIALGEHHKLKALPSYERVIPPNRRYLPAPSHSTSGAELQARMRSEVVLTFTKIK